MSQVVTTLSQGTKRSMDQPFRGPAKKRRTTKKKKSLWTRVPRSPFPDRAITKLKYVDTISLNATSLIDARYFYRCNSLFDPDFTGTGHQPMGFDQYAALYNHYHVHSAYIECIFSGPDNNGNSAHEGHICAITLGNDTADARNLESLLEDSSTVKMVIHGNGNNVGKLTLGYNEKKAFPVDRLGDTHASVSSSPSEIMCWEIVQGPFPGTDPAAINVLVTITFLAEFYERKDLNTS